MCHHRFLSVIKISPILDYNIRFYVVLKELQRFYVTYSIVYKTHKDHIVPSKFAFFIERINISDFHITIHNVYTEQSFPVDMEGIYVTYSNRKPLNHEHPYCF